MAVAAPVRGEILQLYRSFLRVARKFPDYNVREYVKRRTIDGFHHNKSLSDPSSVALAFSEAKSEFQVAQRQALVYSLYAPKFRSIMDLPPHP